MYNAPMPEQENIHATLARSYLMYFIASIVGLFADSFLNLDFHIPFAIVAAIACLLLGPALIAWAQYTSWKCRREGHDNDHYFEHGPYRFLRNPTHMGLVILVTGYTLVSGSVMFFLVTIIGYLASNVFFKKYESILQTTYGEEYDDYKQSVRKIL
jgi:protein-S-isoprenylcysteine O-methyltransferase Ste14